MRSESRAERRREILTAIVRTYIATGEPVGSKCIAGGPGLEVSAATVRNVMAELEELGYLQQPHASAGRVPTDKGYRTYVELLLDGRREASGSPLGDGLAIDLGAAGGDVAGMLALTSRALSRLCGCVGVVLRPNLGLARFRHAQFLRLQPGRVVALLVDEQGGVSDRTIPTREDFSQSELDRISSYIVNRFRGRTLLEVQRTIEAELHEERSTYDAAMRSWLGFALECLEQCLPQGDEVYVDGAARCATAPEFADAERLRGLLEAYEEKDRIARLLRACLERDGIQFRIGAGESGDPVGLPGLAFVASQYGDGGVPLGSIGVLGPMRMEYERVIAVVDRVSRDLGRVLASGGDSPH